MGEKKPTQQQTNKKKNQKTVWAVFFHGIFIVILNFKLEKMTWNESDNGFVRVLVLNQK